MTAYEQCVLNATGQCVRWSHQHDDEGLTAESDAAHRDWVTADGHPCVGGDRCPGCAAALASVTACPSNWHGPWANGVCVDCGHARATRPTRVGNTGRKAEGA